MTSITTKVRVEDETICIDHFANGHIVLTHKLLSIYAARIFINTLEDAIRDVNAMHDAKLEQKTYTPISGNQA